MERNIIVERIRGGIRRAKEKEKTLGWPKRLDLNVRELQEMRNQGLSFNKIAARVHTSPATVYKILSK